MGKVIGSVVLARALRQNWCDAFFFLTGGPIVSTSCTTAELGARAIDVRHEQAAAMAAHGYARVTRKVGVCMTASGPGATNLVTGVANAFVDGAPIVAIGGASPVAAFQKGAFQELDQLPIFKPFTKWAERAYDAIRFPDLVSIAFRQARTGRPGPVYLDAPGDVLYEEVDEETLVFPEPGLHRTTARPLGDPDAVKAAVRLLAQAQRPIVVTGGGTLWSNADAQLRQFVELTGIPFYATPQGRGVIPDDHALSFMAARATAFQEADLILAVGTRFNYMLLYGRTPRFAPDARVIQIDIAAEEIGHNRAVNVGIVGDAAAVLGQLVAEAEGKLSPPLYADWVEHLQAVDKGKWQEAELQMSTDQLPIHPARLCKEIRDFLDRDAILTVDGQAILNIGRQSIPTYVGGHRLNSGPWGCLGVGLPFAMGAKVAKPDKQVLALTGDGSFGLNGMELDTMVRHKLAIVTVVSNNAGWNTGGAAAVGKELGYTNYDGMAEKLGLYAERVDKPEQIRPALERAFKAGVPALLNVIVDRTPARTMKFSDYSGPVA